MISIPDTSTTGKHLRQVLNHPTLGVMFRTFARSRVADEGIHFLDALFAISRPLWYGMDPDYRTQNIIMHNVYNYFLAVEAMEPVCISSGTRAALIDAMKLKEGRPPPLCVIFKDAMREVFMDLRSNNLFYDFCSYNKAAREYVDDSVTDPIRELLRDDWHVKAIREILKKDPKALTQLRFALMVTDPKVSYATIAALYFSNGSSTPWEFILPIYVTAILSDEWDCVFEDARDDCLRELQAHPRIATYLKRTSSTPPQYDRE